MLHVAFLDNSLIFGIVSSTNRDVQIKQWVRERGKKELQRIIERIWEMIGWISFVGERRRRREEKRREWMWWCSGEVDSKWEIYIVVHKCIKPRQSNREKFDHRDRAFFFWHSNYLHYKTKDTYTRFLHRPFRQYTFNDRIWLLHSQISPNATIFFSCSFLDWKV